MSDLPGDPWAALLVGHHWPGSSGLAILSAAAASRQAVGASFHGYADALRSVCDGVLSDQDGETADGVRASFRSGETHARGVAERNTAKREALTRARHCASELRSALTEIADRGGSRIRTIIGGGESNAAKVAAIVEVVRAAHTEADARAAEGLQEVYGSIQSVLDTSGSPTSARQFAHQHGVGPRSPRQAAQPDAIHQQVRELLEKHSGAAESVAGLLGAEIPIQGLPSSTHSTAEPAVTVAVPLPPATAPVGQPRISAAVAATASPSPIRTAATSPIRPLLPYGAGLRPTAAPSVATPVSAPRTVAPAAGPTTAAAAVFTRATAAAVATVEQARPVDPASRLRALLHAVARQQPALRWAVSADGESIFLATDLASGWIPPHIGIPDGVELLTPAARAGHLTGWFRPGAVTVTHEPGQLVPPAGDSAHMRDRAAAPVDELGWKLLQATRWRPGLPRLSHTAARAALTGPGLLDSEVTQLHGHLQMIAEHVVAGYPDSVDVAQVGDWQLLATIEALLSNENSSAHYHFAWFEALGQESR